MSSFSGSYRLYVLSHKEDVDSVTSYLGHAEEGVQESPRCTQYTLYTLYMYTLYIPHVNRVSGPSSPG